LWEDASSGKCDSGKCVGVGAEDFVGGGGDGEVDGSEDTGNDPANGYDVGGDVMVAEEDDGSADEDDGYDEGFGVRERLKGSNVEYLGTLPGVFGTLMSAMNGILSLFRSRVWGQVTNIKFRCEELVRGVLVQR